MRRIRAKEWYDGEVSTCVNGLVDTSGGGSSSVSLDELGEYSRGVSDSTAERLALTQSGANLNWLSVSRLAKADASRRHRLLHSTTRVECILPKFDLPTHPILSRHAKAFLKVASS